MSVLGRSNVGDQWSHGIFRYTEQIGDYCARGRARSVPGQAMALVVDPRHGWEGIVLPMRRDNDPRVH